MSGPLLFLETLEMESTGSHERVGEGGDDVVEREKAEIKIILQGNKGYRMQCIQ